LAPEAIRSFVEALKAGDVEAFKRFKRMLYSDPGNCARIADAFRCKA